MKKLIGTQESFLAECPHCSGLGFTLLNRSKIPMLVADCTTCGGNGALLVAKGIYDDHKCEIKCFVGPNVDNNWQSVYGCGPCGTRFLG